MARQNLEEMLRAKPRKPVKLSASDATTTHDWSIKPAKVKTEENIRALEDLQYHLYADSRKSLLIVLQGIDASGKDGLIRKIFTAFNPQGTHVSSFKAPSSKELSHDFLWRVHDACPPRGSIGIFNRSHYEDLIVPMVNKSLKKNLIDQRIEQINNFEQMLTQEGTTVIKFLLHISRDEQWDRMKERLDEPTRNWKFNMGDLAERKRWDLYISTYKKIISETSSEYAPWYVIPANAKWFRNLAVSEIVKSTLKTMKMQWPKTSIDLKVARKELNRLR